MNIIETIKQNPESRYWEHFDATNFDELQAYFVEDISYYKNANFLPL